MTVIKKFHLILDPDICLTHSDTILTLPDTQGTLSERTDHPRNVQGGSEASSVNVGTIDLRRPLLAVAALED